MIVEAWQCERCGRLYPAEFIDVLPKGWLQVYIERAGAEEAEEPRTFCSDPCAGLWFKKVTPARSKPKAVAKVGRETVFICPECDKTYEMPQHLGMHRKREHGIASKRDRKKT